MKLVINLKKMIVLVGLMGAGKTSIGKKLADKLRVGFIDADHEIELAAGMDIVEIFDRFGENYFRDGEKRVIERLLHQRPQILATGGGAFVSKDIREIISKKAVSIWLRADIETLWFRVSENTSRPLLNKKNPKQQLKKLLDERYPIYAQANITVDSTISISQGEMVKKIISEIEKQNLM